MNVDMGNGITGTVTSLSGNTVTVKIKNPAHPFSDKKLTVGAIDTYGS
jgi:hypothetical protein